MGDQKKGVPDAHEVGAKLRQVITDDRTGLQEIYGKTEAELNKSLEVPTRTGEEMARKLIREMECSYEIAIDLTLDGWIDDSGSMICEENGARKETLIQYVDCITEIYTMANESGILAMRFMNSRGEKRNWTGKSREYLDLHSYRGAARIGTELKRKILDKFVIGNPNQIKPLLVITITGGIISGERRGLLRNVIRDCVNERVGAGKGFDGPPAATFQFSKIGTDTGGTQLLGQLDQDQDLGQYIDMLPLEPDFGRQLAEDKWFVLPKILLGAILPDVRLPHPTPIPAKFVNNGTQWDRQDCYGHCYAITEDHLAVDVEGSAGDDSGEDWAE
ncbi:unnamed protein product [Tuber aestivum]|uniref:Uncharacterized protein n=1 Tax=Tuber aestivum TaxID=59557 RepID=A0A292PZA6_9PEZI|nr:unnamed protein product [Tuber aestivum]